MKIALIIERFDMHAGGAERSTAQIAKGLVVAGHKVTIVTWWHKHGHELPGVSIEACSKYRTLGPVNLLRFSKWARRRLVDGGFDSSLSVTTAVPAAVLQPRSGTFRETFERNVAMRRTALGRTAKRLLTTLSPKSRMQLRLERQVFADPSIKLIVAISDYVAEQFDRHYGITGPRVQVIPNASDIARPSEEQRSRYRKVVRRGFGIDDDMTVFLFAAHNPKLKGADTLLQATRLLSQRNVEFVLLMAGHMSYSLQRRSAMLGVRDRIRFVGSTNRMAELFCAADVTVHPTYYDPSSKVVIESLLSGTPAITTVFNGASKWIDSADGAGEPARGRILADPADPVALADAMMQLLEPIERDRCRPDLHNGLEQLTMAYHVGRLEQLLSKAAD